MSSSPGSEGVLTLDAAAGVVWRAGVAFVTMRSATTRHRWSHAASQHQRGSVVAEGARLVAKQQKALSAVCSTFDFRSREVDE